MAGVSVVQKRCGAVLWLRGMSTERSPLCGEMHGELQRKTQIIIGLLWVVKPCVVLKYVVRQQILHSSLFTLHFFLYLCTRKIKNGALDEWLSLRSAKPSTAVRIRHAPQKSSVNWLRTFCFLYRGEMITLLRRGCRFRRSRRHRTISRGVSWPSPESRDQCRSTPSSAHRAAPPGRR